MADDPVESAESLSEVMTQTRIKTDELTVSATGLSRALTSAFQQSAVQGRQFDDVLRSLALRLSNMAVTQAFRPLSAGLASGMNTLIGGLFGTGKAIEPIASGATYVKPFADGGVIGTPSYFPLGGGGLGLAGEAGPEAIIPLQRGSDGKLGVAAGAQRAPAVINVHIATPDAESFRRSETYVTGQIARAVARGHRSL